MKSVKFNFECRCDFLIARIVKLWSNFSGYQTHCHSECLREDIITFSKNIEYNRIRYYPKRQKRKEVCGLQQLIKVISMVSSGIRACNPDEICCFLRYHQHHDSSYVWIRVKAVHSYKWKIIYVVRQLWWFSSPTNHSRQGQLWSWVRLLRTLSSWALSIAVIPSFSGVQSSSEYLCDSQPLWATCTTA